MKTSTHVYQMLYAFALCLLPAFSVQAQAPFAVGDSISGKPLEEYTLEELMNVTVVSVSKKAEKISQTPSNITVVTAQQIKEWGARDIKDVLKRTAGFQVIGDRDEFVFACRGNVGDNNQKYLILIDGHRMNSYENFGPGNIIEMPNNLSNVKQVEIIRGPGSAVWGSDALAGVINIITYDVQDLKESTARAAVSYGQNNYMTADVQVGKKLNPESEVMFMGTFGMQGGREVTQSASTGFPIMDASSGYSTHPLGTYTTQLDKHYPGYMLQLKATYGAFKINAYAFETEVFNRQYESNKGRLNTLATYKQFVEGTYSKTLGKDLDFVFKISSDINNTEYVPVKQGTATKLPTNLLWRDRGFTSMAGIIKPLGEKVKLYSGFDYKISKIGPNIRINGINPDSATLSTNKAAFWVDNYVVDHQAGAYVLSDIQLARFLTFIIGTRADYNPHRGSDRWNVNPRVALVATPSQNTILKAFYNRGYLRPSNFQTTGTSISSETMDQFDLIWMQKIGRMSLTVTGYWQELRGFINILPGLTGFANTGDYTSMGIEVEGNIAVSSAMNIWFNGTFSDPKAGNFVKDLPYNSQRVDLNGKLLSYPGQYASSGTTWYLLNRKLFVSPAVRVVGNATYRIIPAANADADKPENYAQSGIYTYLDANIGYEPTPRLGFYVYGDNILDNTKQIYQSVWNGTMGQYGRHVNVKIRMTF